MRAGIFRDKLKLERPSLVKTATGGYEPDPQGPATGWDFVCDVWAEVKDISARERFAVGQLDTGMTTTVTTRFDERIDATCRFKFGVRVLNVIGPPIRDFKRRHMTLTCSEKAL